VVEAKEARGSIAALAASRLVFVVSGLVVNLAMARMLPRETFGEARWLLSVTAIAAFGANLGLGAWLTRTLAREPERAGRVVPAALRTAGLLAAGTTASVCAYVAARDPRPEMVATALLAGLALAAQALGQLAESSLHGLHQTRREVGPVLAGRGLLVVGTLVALAAGGGLLPLFGVRLVAQAVATLWMVRTLAVVTGGLRWSEAEPPARELVRTGTTFAATVLFSAVAAQADVLLLELLRGDLEVARYAAPASVLLQLGLGATILTRSFFPAIARLSDQPAASAEVLAVQARFLLLASLPVALGGLAVGADAVPWLFGEAYADAVAPFLILVAVTPLRYLHNGLGLALTALDGQASRARIDGGVAAFNVAANLVVIPAYGAVGAAGVTLLTDLLLLALVHRAVSARVPSTGIAAALRAVAPAAVTMALGVAMMPGTPPLRVLVGAALYAGLVRVTGAWRPGDRAALRAL
jgi:O-antigen/teichoic acid export membrane protein